MKKNELIEEIRITEEQIRQCFSKYARKKLQRKLESLKEKLSNGNY